MSFLPRIKKEFRSDTANIASSSEAMDTAGDDGEVGGIGGGLDLDGGDDDRERMLAMGLPASLAGGTAAGGGAGGSNRFVDQNVALGRKKEKQNFICKVCNIDDLNSMETLTKHQNGMQHVYNVFKAYKKAKDEGRTDFNDPDNPWLCAIEEVPAPKAVQKKLCIRLVEKLRETSEPLVGLNHITEIIACSSEEEPYYHCEVCGTKGQANMMFNHLLGREHRKQMLKILDPSAPLDLNADTVKRRLEPYRENEYLSNITTVYSDELYPWEAGKAPWSVEKGGTGETPTATKDKSVILLKTVAGRGGAAGYSTQVDSKEGILSSAGGSAATFESLSARAKACPINNTPELRKAYDLVLDVIQRCSEHQTHEKDPSHVNLLVTSAKVTLTSLKALGHKDDKPDQPEPWEDAAAAVPAPRRNNGHRRPPSEDRGGGGGGRYNGHDRASRHDDRRHHDRYDDRRSRGGGYDGGSSSSSSNGGGGGGGGGGGRKRSYHY